MSIVRSANALLTQIKKTDDEGGKNMTTNNDEDEVSSIEEDMSVLPTDEVGMTQAEADSQVGQHYDGYGEPYIAFEDHGFDEDVIAAFKPQQDKKTQYDGEKTTIMFSAEPFGTVPVVPFVEGGQLSVWQRLIEANSVYVYGGTGTGKTAWAYGASREMAEFKTVYWYKCPRRDLLKKEGWQNLDNLNQISKLTDAFVVIDEAVLVMRQDKKNNDLLERLLVLARQNDLTLVILSQLSQTVNRALESLIDCFVVMDCDYHNLKQGSRIRNMIRDYTSFEPEHFKLPRGTFLYYSRNYPCFEKVSTFSKPDGFTDEWSKAYKNVTKEPERSGVTPISNIEWRKQ